MTTLKHVLIVRLSAIGDCVLTFPVASAIKAAFPDVQVSWCVSCAAHSLLDICPDVDNVIRVSKRWVREPGEWRRIRRLFRSNPVDCVIDPQSLSKSALLGWLSGAKTRVGFTPPLGREFGPWLNTITINGENAHLADAQLRLLRPLGIENPVAEFRLSVPVDIQLWAKKIILDLTNHQAPFVVNPGAGWDSRLWPTERFGQVAAWMQSEFDRPTLVVWAGEKERMLAGEIVAASRGAATLAPDTDLIQLAAILSQAELFLSSDTGPMHIAAAMGTRCLSLHGPTPPELSGPHGDHHVSIRKVAYDGPGRRGADDSAMKAIGVSDVVEQLSIMMREQVIGRSVA